MERWLVPGVLALVGIPFLGSGIGLGFWSTRSLSTAAEMAATPMARASSFQEAGTRVWLEGDISDRTPPGEELPFVAYRRYRRVTRDGETTWELRERHSPPLWVQGVDLEVEVTSGYTIGRTIHSERDGADLYEGLRVRDPVVVIGEVVAPAAPPKLQSATVAFGTYETYIADLNQGVIVLRWMARGFMGLGGVLVLGALYTGFSTWRHYRQQR